MNVELGEQIVQLALEKMSGTICPNGPTGASHK
jgi:hypothetical protein